MIIQQKKISKLVLHIPTNYMGRIICFGIKNPTNYNSVLSAIGFPSDINFGDRMLPSATLGPVCRFNAEGRYIVRRDKPKETHYRWVDWHWKEFHGKERVSNHKVIPVEYLRYPRDFISPPSIELLYAFDSSGTPILVSPPVEYISANTSTLTHTINLFLEIFGICEVFFDNFESIIKTPLRNLNWTILPRGTMMWAEMKKHLAPIVEKARIGNRAPIQHRFETVNNYRPSFTAIGLGGFRGYVIFGFPDKGVFVLESIFPGNATYVFDKNWEELSKLSKQEILSESKQLYRFIHAPNWYKDIEKLLR